MSLRSTTMPTSRCSARATAIAPRAAGRRARRVVRRRPVPLPDGALLPVDPRRRRLGVHRTARPSRWGARSARASSTATAGDRSSVPRSCSPTIESNWSPIDYEVSDESTGRRRRTAAARVSAVIAILLGVVGGVACSGWLPTSVSTMPWPAGPGARRLRHRARLRRRRHLRVVRGDRRANSTTFGATVTPTPTSIGTQDELPTVTLTLVDPDGSTRSNSSPTTVSATTPATSAGDVDRVGRHRHAGRSRPAGRVGRLGLRHRRRT